MRNIHRTEVDFTTARPLVFTHEREFVLFRHLLGYHFRGVVEFVVAVFVGYGIVADLLSKPVAEWFHNWEDDASLAWLHGVVLYEVELSVWIWLVVVVQAVQVHHLQQRGLLPWLFRQIVQVHTRRVAQVLHVEFEFLLLYGLCSQGIHVLHHQVPVAIAWGVVRVLQQFHEQCLLGVLHVGRELTHLVGRSACRIFVSDSEHLVRLHGRFQRHVAQVGIQCVF